MCCIERMKLIVSIFYAFLTIFLPMDTSHANSCALLVSEEDYRAISSKSEAEKVLERELRLQYQKFGGVDLVCIAGLFADIGRNFSVRRFVNNNVGRSSYHFTVVKFPSFPFIPAPGGSNGRYVAIVTQEADGKIYIVERGGIMRWLRFE